MKIVSLDLTNIPSVIFWDMDIRKLSIRRDYKIIISRILMFTNKTYFENNISILESYFKPSEIIKVIKETNERISDEVCALLSEKYNVTIFSKFGI